jgi:UDP-glucose 4-epimerase
MKLLIIGGTGFIGRNLKEYFNKQSGITVYAPTRKELDLFDDVLCLAYIKNLKPDIVIHAAFEITSVENSLKTFYNIYNAQEYFGHMIQIGSGSEYDRRSYEPKINETPFFKSVPIDTYGLIKFSIATVLENAPSKKFTNLRCFGMFGKYEDYSRRFISNNICNTLSGLPISLNRDMLFDYIWVEDFAKFTHSILDKIPLSSVSYNFCSGNPISLLNLAEIINKLMDSNLEILVRNPGMNKEYSGDPAKLFKEVGSFEFTSFENSIASLIKFYKDSFTSEDIANFREISENQVNIKRDSSVEK